MQLEQSVLYLYSNASYKRVNLQDVMRKGVENNQELGEGAALYYLASKFSIIMSQEIANNSIFNETSLVKFTVQSYEVFKIEFK